MAKKVKKTAKKKTSVPKTATKKSAVKKVKKATAKKVPVKKTAKKKSVRKKATTPASKSTTKGSSPSKAVKRQRRARRKSKLSKAELVRFRELLVEKLKEIMGDVDHIESEALKKSRLDASGDLSSMPIHMADIGSDNYEQEFSLELMDSERKIVRDIFAALKRIEEGNYGICEGTGDPIPKARLEGIPWTPYCVKYAEMVEKGLASEEDHWYDYDEDEDDENTDDGDVDDDDEDEYMDEDEAEKEALFYGYEDDDEESI